MPFPNTLLSSIVLNRFKMYLLVSHIQKHSISIKTIQWIQSASLHPQSPTLFYYAQLIKSLASFSSLPRTMAQPWLSQAFHALKSELAKSSLKKQELGWVLEALSIYGLHISCDPDRDAFEELIRDLDEITSHKDDRMDILRLFMLERQIKSSNDLANLFQEFLAIKNAHTHWNQEGCSAIIRVACALSSQDASLLSFKKVKELWSALRIDHGFVPALQDYHSLMSLTHIVAQTTTLEEALRDRTEREQACQGLFESLIRSGLSPTHTTFTHLFQSCILTPRIDPFEGGESESLLEHEQTMFEWGLGHTPDTVHAICQGLFCGKLYDQGLSRMDHLARHRPLSTDFYVRLLTCLIQTRAGSLYSIKELWYRIKRDSNVSMDASIYSNLLKACEQVQDAEAGYQIFQEARDKRLCSMELVQRMAWIWREEWSDRLEGLKDELLESEYNALLKA